MLHSEAISSSFIRRSLNIKALDTSNFIFGDDVSRSAAPWVIFKWATATLVFGWLTLLLWNTEGPYHRIQQSMRLWISFAFEPSFVRNFIIFSFLDFHNFYRVVLLHEAVWKYTKAKISDFNQFYLWITNVFNEPNAIFLGRIYIPCSTNLLTSPRRLLSPL